MDKIIYRYLIINTFISVLFLLNQCSSFPSKIGKKQVRIAIVGDIMCHNSQLGTYWNAKTKSYSADSSFEYVKPILQNYDIVFGNLETTITKDQADHSGYPRFGSPPGFVQSIAKAGFHVLSTANNHSADKGAVAIDLTIETVLAEGMIPLGTYSSESDYQSRRHFILEKNGIRIAVYNYTYSTNGIKVPGEKIVRLIEEKKIREDIRFSKTRNVDFTLVWFHFGTEYKTEPDKDQIKWVDIALEEGADLIIGGHPHVVQNFKKIETTSNESISKQQLVAYSLGNFLSAQNAPFTDGGIILNFDLVVNGKSSKEIMNINYEPVWVYPSGYRIIPIDKYLNQEIDLKLPKHSEAKMKAYKTQLLKVLK
ncbi:CapA family protein [Leptospira ilyithenensis]|uniref:CapA family protein n=1 Tax=Leptospira ilyithenensis TaxID=2484901 RepID=A0A4R9LPP7_9LEPT|nr:CapA family protein [Leptospira ilyithenensis]